MMNLEQSIPCPTCQTKIPFDVQQLLRGMEFSCPGCHASIGISTESRPLVEETMEKFSEMKKKTGQSKYGSTQF